MDLHNAYVHTIIEFKCVICGPNPVLRSIRICLAKSINSFGLVMSLKPGMQIMSELPDDDALPLCARWPAGQGLEETDHRANCIATARHGYRLGRQHPSASIHSNQT